MPGRRWPGRLELSRPAGTRRSAPRREVLLDGAHNPAGAAVLARALDDLRPTLQRRRLADPPPVTLSSRTMADKDVAGVLAALARRRSRARPGSMCTQVDLPRALPGGPPRQAAGRPSRRAPGRRWSRRRRPRSSGRWPRPTARSSSPDRSTSSAQCGPSARRRPGAARRAGRRDGRPDRPVPKPSPRSGERRRGGPLELGSTLIGGRPFHWGERTFVMGIVNATPDSFSGDGLVGAAGADPVVDGRVAQAEPDGRRGRRPARRRRRVDPTGPRAGRRGRGAGPGRPVVAAVHAAHARGRRSASTRRSRRSPRPRSTRAPTLHQRRLGGRRRRRPAPAGRRARRADRSLMHNRARAALHGPRGRDRRRPRSGDRAGDPARLRRASR